MILIKDIISEFASNFWIYLKMRRDENQYTALGGRIYIDDDMYIIKKITWDTVFLRKKGNGKMIRIPIKKYWNSRIEYGVSE